MRLISQIVILSICSMSQAAQIEDIGFIDYDFDFTELYRTTSQMPVMTFEIDHESNLHVFFLESRPSGYALMYFIHKSGVSDVPQEILLQDTRFCDLRSRMESPDVIHLVWSELNDETNELGRIHYARFNLSMQTIDQHEIVFSEETGRLPDIEVEPDGDAHVSFEFREITQSGWENYYLGYAHQVDGVFQPLETSGFSEHQYPGSFPDMCINQEGTAYFIGAGAQHPVLLTYRNGQFESPVEITDFYNYYISGSTLDRRRIICDQDGTVHVYMVVSLDEESDFWTTRIVHLETEDGIHFSEPEFVTTAHDDFRFVSDPLILADGTKMVFYFKPTTLHPYYSMDRGYGYGNPVESVAGGFTSEKLSLPENVARFNPSGVDFSVLITYSMFDQEEHQYYNYISVYESKRTPHDQPYVEINTFPALAFYNEHVTLDDTFRVSLDVYNPLSTEIHADLVLLSEIFIAGESFFHFYCPSGSTLFSEDYCGIPVIIPGNLNVQNAAVYEIFLGVFPEDSFVGDWWWWCALLDPVSLQPISNVCLDATAVVLE